MELVKLLSIQWECFLYIFSYSGPPKELDYDSTGILQLSRPLALFCFLWCQRNNVMSAYSVLRSYNSVAMNQFVVLSFNNHPQTQLQKYKHKIKPILHCFTSTLCP